MGDLALLVSVIHTADAKKLHRELTRAERSVGRTNGRGLQSDGIKLGDLKKIFGEPKLMRPPGVK